MFALRGSRLAAIVLSLGLLVSLFVMPGAASATPLAPAPTPVVSGTDMAVAGIGGLYDTGGGDLTLSGIGSGVVTSAWLYWSGPTDSTDPAANATISFAGTDITGTSVGVDGANCFDFVASQAFRADVTALVSGDGTYAIANTSKADPRAGADGASLIAFYDDGNVANDRDVYLYEGNDADVLNGGASVWDATLGGIEYSRGSAEMTLHVANGQYDANGSLNLNGEPLANPAVFDGVSVPTAPGSNYPMWDIVTWDITSYLTPGTNTLQLDYVTGGDCISLIVATVSVEHDILSDLWPQLVDQIRMTGTRSQQSLMLLYVLMAQPQAEHAPANACLVMGQLDRYVQNQVDRRRLTAGAAQLVLQRSQAIQQGLGCGNSPG